MADPAAAARPADAARASRGLGFALALSATVFWSLAGILIRLIGEATSWHIILYRSLGATAMVGAMIAIVHRGRVVQAIRLAGWPAVVAGVCSSASSVLFILALRGLSSPETSRRGNYLGMAGMAIAVLTLSLIHI